MIVFYPNTQTHCKHIPQVIAIFGVGLLGGSIYRNIINQVEIITQQRFDFDWISGEKQNCHAQKIHELLTKINIRSNTRIKRVVIVWSAGSAGFSSNNEEVANELSTFQTVLDIARRLKTSLISTAVEFHLVSSAGGLFEGRTYVDEQTAPKPCRPYGYLKQAQEQLLLDEDLLIPQIYRPSTVYGPILSGTRRGLVSTLLHNGSLKVVSNILGHLYTLRDYVYYDDIGRYISDSILLCEASKRQRVSFLVSGKPTSIFELIHIIERILKHRLYFKLQYHPNNSCDINFSPSVSPNDWRPTALEYGCERIYREWQAQGGLRQY